MMSYTIKVVNDLQYSLYELSWLIIPSNCVVDFHNEKDVEWLEHITKGRAKAMNNINKLNKENILVFIAGTILNDSTSLNRFSNDPLYDRNVLRHIFEFLLH